jgi:hypothetical protein
MSGINTLHQKSTSILMIFIMLILPFLSINASAHTSMQNMPQTAMQTAMQTPQNSLHDCCDDSSATAIQDCCKLCQHGDQCNCDSGQLSSSVALTMVTVLPEAVPATIYHPIISSSFRSKITGSPYRPPITRL